MTAAMIAVELPEELEERSTMCMPSDESDVTLTVPAEGGTESGRQRGGMRIAPSRRTHSPLK
jgi:hypothetical protein